MQFGSNKSHKEWVQVRIVACLILAGVLSGCAGIPINVAPPGIEEFPQGELPFRVVGDNEMVLQRIQDYLVSRGLPSVVTVRGRKTFVVTTYVEEPRRPEDRRLRRTAFRLALSQSWESSSALCTSVAVVSLTQSRGIREEAWSVQDTDTTFVSSIWPEMKALLEKKVCK